MKIVYVEWRDACWQEEVESAEECVEYISMITVGVLVRETKRAVILAQDWDEDGGFRNTASIPKSNIVRKKTVGKVETRGRFRKG